MNPDVDDQPLRALMQSYQAGRFEAFDALYARVAPPVRRFVASRLYDASRVDDVVQDTFLQMHRARRSYDPAHPVMPWVLAIARHCWLMELRRAARRPVNDLAAGHLDQPVPVHGEPCETGVELDRALARVPASQRQAVVAHHIWGLSFDEIGAQLGIAGTAAKLRSSRGVRRLRELLSPRHGR
jgi:RNA polymerase sigma-70 factor (ECF subfamily)